MKINVNIDPPGKVTPLVLRLRCRLRNVALGPAAKTLGSFNTVVGIKDESSAQTATICFSGASIVLTTGIADDADFVATGELGDFTSLSCSADEGKAVIAAINADGPDLESAANSFWDEAQGQDGVPSSLLIESTDGGGRIQLGDGDEAFEIHGTSAELLAFLTSDKLLMEQVGASAVAVKGNIPELCALTGFGMGRLFDD